MERLPSDLINIPGFEPMQPSDAASDDTDWEIDEFEIRQCGRKEYPPNTLYQTCCRLFV